MDYSDNEVATGDIPLKWEVFITKRQGLSRDLPPGKEQWMWVPTSATLIYGQRDAVLVDAFLTIEQAFAMAEWVAASGKNLTTIYVTHGHGDHFFGIGVLQNRFPNAKAVATPEVVIAGHKRPEKDGSPRIIEETRQYIRDFDRLSESTSNALELYEKLLELYPDCANPGSLWGSAHAVKG